MAEENWTEALRGDMRSTNGEREMVVHFRMPAGFRLMVSRPCDGLVLLRFEPEPQPASAPADAYQIAQASALEGMAKMAEDAHAAESIEARAENWADQISAGLATKLADGLPPDDAFTASILRDLGDRGPLALAVERLASRAARAVLRRELSRPTPRSL